MGFPIRNLYEQYMHIQLMVNISVTYHLYNYRCYTQSSLTLVMSMCMHKRGNMKIKLINNVTILTH